MAAVRNLPPASAPFVGRGAEVAELLARLSEGQERVVTVLGPPGVGKTRLAVEVARAADGFDDGAFVSLAEVVDPAGVASAILRALGLDDVGAGRPLDRIAARVGAMRFLLVLDNVEHVVEAATEIAELVAACPGLSVLATSRRALEIRAEHGVELEPLAVPPPGSSVTEIEHADCVTLLVARLGAAGRPVAVDDRIGPVLADICRAADGLPLALELVASRARGLPLATLREGLQHRLSALDASARDLPVRHRTMRAALAWSCELLDTTTATVFRRMSAFVGGADLEAVAAVTADLDLDRPALIAALAELGGHSLLRIQDDPARFGMLEVVRQYAAGLLTDAEEDGATGRRHAEHFVAVAELAAPHFSGPDQADWLERTQRDAANFAQAIRWAVANDEPDLALRLCLALRFLWYVRGPLAEGRSLFEAALAVASATPRLHALAAVEAAALARHQTDYPAAKAWLDRALAVALAEDDLDLKAAAELQQGFVAHLQGDYELARTALSSCIARRHETGDEFGKALASHHLGLVAHYGEGNLGLAWEMQSRCLALFRRFDNQRHIATALIGMTELARARGELDVARKVLRESLACIEPLGDVPLLIYALHHAAAIAYDEGHSTQALRLIGAADEFERTSGALTWPAVRAGTDRWLGRARGSMGSSRADAVLESGRGLAFADAILLAVRADDAADPLTSREREIAGLVADGLTNRAIADRLVVSERTVEGHVTHVLAKLGFSRRSQIAGWFARNATDG